MPVSGVVRIERDVWGGWGLSWDYGYVEDWIEEWALSEGASEGRKGF